MFLLCLSFGLRFHNLWKIWVSQHAANKISLGQNSHGWPTSCPPCFSPCPVLCWDLLCLTGPARCLLGVHQHSLPLKWVLCPIKSQINLPGAFPAPALFIPPLNPNALTFLTCLNTGYQHSVTHPASWQYCFEMLFTRSKVISVLLSNEQNGLLI